MQKFLKTIILIFAFVTIGCLFFLSSRTIFPNGEKREIYLSDNSSSCRILFLKNEAICFSKVGESVTITCEEISPLEILDNFNAELVKIEETEEGISYYAFSKEIKYCRKLFGRKVNLHIFAKEGEIKIGSPIIYGSY